MTYRGLRVPDDIAQAWDTGTGQAWRRGVDQAINTTTMDEVRERAERRLALTGRGRKAT
jgi:hypothetical protein